MWRNYGDISDSWDSIASIITFYGNDATKFAEVAGPGNVNDPDMVILMADILILKSCCQ